MIKFREWMLFWRQPSFGFDTNVMIFLHPIMLVHYRSVWSRWEVGRQCPLSWSSIIYYTWHAIWPFLQFSVVLKWGIIADIRQWGAGEKGSKWTALCRIAMKVQVMRSEEEAIALAGEPNQLTALPTPTFLLPLLLRLLLLLHVSEETSALSSLTFMQEDSKLPRIKYETSIDQVPRVLCGVLIVRWHLFLLCKSFILYIALVINVYVLVTLSYICGTHYGLVLFDRLGCGPTSVIVCVCGVLLIGQQSPQSIFGQGCSLRKSESSFV